MDFEELKSRIEKEGDQVSGFEVFVVELTWWGFYVLTGLVPGLLIRLNYSKALKGDEDDSDDEEECLQYLKAKDTFRHKIATSKRQLLVIRFLI